MGGEQIEPDEPVLELDLDEFIEAYSDDPDIWGYLTSIQQAEFLDELVTAYLLGASDDTSEGTT